VVRVAQALGAEYKTPKRGSHHKLKLPNKRSYPVPAHNGLKSKVQACYVKKLCKTAGWDFDEFIAEF
jgi:predicted RNA binding protein YcfA (HicA-like mRNA interferase family)